MKKLFAITFLTAILAFAFDSGTASAATILTFDTAGSFNPYTEAGMTITPVAGSSAVTITGGAWSLGCCNAGNYDFEFTSGLFDFLIMDFAHSDQEDPITFQGFQGAALIATQVVNSLNAGTVNFVGFTAVDRIRMHVSGIFRDPTMDNLTYNAVPEPSTGLLMSLGLVAMTASKRRLRIRAA